MTDTPKVQAIAELEALADEHEQTARDIREQIKRMKQCQHVWDNENGKYVSHLIPAQHFAGDPPGTMGVDRQLPFTVEAKTVSQWERTCTKCGHVQVTTYTKEVIEGGLKKQVPAFAVTPSQYRLS